MGNLTYLGVLMVMFGILATLAGFIFMALEQGRANVKAGGVLFIGPIPIIFGSDRMTAVIVAALALILMAAYYLTRR